MPSYSGVWTLTAQYQAKASLLWPQGPGAPTSVSATAGDSSATVTFVAPTFTGVPPGITGYLATSSPGGLTATSASSPLTVTGLSNGTAYTFGVQATNGVQYGPAGTSGSVSPQATFGYFAGGDAGGALNVIDFLSLASAGNASDFGDLSTARRMLAACASTTRGLFGGGVWTNAITYITFASQGNSVSFGNLTPAYVGSLPASLSNSTRGIWAGGSDPFTFGGRLNVIGYVTIASTGNATDFGDLTGITSGALDQTTGAASSTRGIVFGGQDDSNKTSNIQYITIATTGNSTTFGNLTVARSGLAAASSSTRAVIGGGTTGDAFSNTIDYVTMASTGNATGFGSLTSTTNILASCSSQTNAVFGGGNVSGVTNVIDKITIATTGNATDFGDLTVARQDLSACSNGGGGL